MQRARPWTSLLAAAALGAAALAQPPQREIDNVAAFARLYGVVRYFCPTDAAAGLDWDGFAIHGVKDVLAAADATALARTLARLFQPLGPGIEIGRTLAPAHPIGQADGSLVSWRYLGPGFSNDGLGPYKGKRTNRPLTVAASIDGFASLMQMVSAEALRGRTIRLRGRARTSASDSTGAAALWLRVDRADSKTGFFDNMGDRPIRESAWREYTIEGPVAEDAASIALGVMASGAATADFDQIELAVRDGNDGWTAVPIKDGGFEGAAGSTDWVRVGSSKTVEITRVAQMAPEGAQFLRLAAPAVPPVTAELFADAVPVAGTSIDIDLGSGLKARVALALTDAVAAATKTDTGLDALRASLRTARGSGTQPSAAARLADTVVAWNVFRHFYPYWTEAAVDWDSRLRTHLESAYAAQTPIDHVRALRLLVADVRDGHGSVIEPARTPRGALPIRVRVIENQLVVTASDSGDAPAGAVITTIANVPAMTRVRALMTLASGTTQWKETRALQEVVGCDRGASVGLVVQTGTAPRPLTLQCGVALPPAERRPDAIAELSVGIWYVDLTRANMAQIRPMLAPLSKAAGVVFDLRGYPTDAGAQILPYLIDAPEGDRWMHVAQIVGPFGQTAGWQSVGWNLRPQTPHLGGKIVFMTDGRAISYSESVMGYVKDRKLATIVGSTTAGANGNVVRFQLPSGFGITFTGMRVTGHDGRTPHHLRGVEPDDPVSPTIEGVRKGRDEVLDRAVILARRQP